MGVILKMCPVLGTAELRKAPSNTIFTVGRCKVCAHSIVDTSEYKEKHQKLNKNI